VDNSHRIVNLVRHSSCHLSGAATFSPR
jgi:hypothetical protein